MSFTTSTLKCDGCGREINVAFGIVGTTQIAAYPSECPDCGSKDLAKIADGWHAADPPNSPQAAVAGDLTQITHEMIEAGIASLGADDDRSSGEVAADCYRAMASASPLERAAFREALELAIIAGWGCSDTPQRLVRFVFRALSDRGEGG